MRTFEDSLELAKTKMLDINLKTTKKACFHWSLLNCTGKDFSCQSNVNVVKLLMVQSKITHFNCVSGKC
jgi:hypothetical protein